MSEFDWKKHADCLTLRVPHPGILRCNADRAEMIAEGERLESELGRVKQDCWILNGTCELLEVENARLRAEVAEHEKAHDEQVHFYNEVSAAKERLREALERILEEPHGCPMCDSGKLRRRSGEDLEHWSTCGYLLARAALAGVKP